MTAHVLTRIARGERGLTVEPGKRSSRPSKTLIQRIRLGAARLGIPVEEYQSHVEKGERWCSPHRGWECISGFVLDRTTPDGVGRQCKAAAREYQAARRTVS